MQRHSIQRLGRRTWAAGLGLGVGSVLGSFLHVRGRSPVVTRSCSRGSRTVADAGERHATVLESVLGATPQEFESPILRHAGLRQRAWIMVARCANRTACVSFSVSVEPAAICLIPDKPVWWHAEMTHVVAGQRRR